MPRIVGLGEVLWDIFPEYKRPGGAPANVTYHVSVMGNTGMLASRIGNDTNGNALLRFLEGRELNLDCVQVDPDKPTGSVDVTFNNKGEPSYRINEDAAWDYMEYSEDWESLTRETDAVCFGTLAQRSEQSRATIRQFLDGMPKSCLRILDLNLREPFYNEEIIRESLQRCEVLKLNRDERDYLAGFFKTDNFYRHVFDAFGVQIICLTKGDQGSELITPDSHIVEPRHKIDVSGGDNVGVGDAFTAILTHRILQDSPLEEALASANRYAAHIASLKGGMPEVPEVVIESVY